VLGAPRGVLGALGRIAPTCRRPVSMNLGSESNDCAKGLDQRLSRQITRVVIKCHNAAGIEIHLRPRVKQRPGCLDRLGPKLVACAGSTIVAHKVASRTGEVVPTD
jgi:hypothetical protein